MQSQIIRRILIFKYTYINLYFTNEDRISTFVNYHLLESCLLIGSHRYQQGITKCKLVLNIQPDCYEALNNWGNAQRDVKYSGLLRSYPKLQRNNHQRFLSHLPLPKRSKPTRGLTQHLSPFGVYHLKGEASSATRLPQVDIFLVQHGLACLLQQGITLLTSGHVLSPISAEYILYTQRVAS